MLTQIIREYGLEPEKYRIRAHGTGLINATWKLSSGDAEYILQRINTHVFKFPEKIASNLFKLKSYLSRFFPEYLFPAPLPAMNGELLVLERGYCYRLLPFVMHSHTQRTLTHPDQAYEAAAQFASLSRRLKDFPVSDLEYSVPDFHNLPLRMDQYREALKLAERRLLADAEDAIVMAGAYAHICDKYNDILRFQQLKLRVVHHDAKLSNVLFDSYGRGMALVDFDTLMPGFFISDVGDMMRTFLCAADEDEQDPELIFVRPDFFEAIYLGYMSEMKHHLSAAEKALFVYSGEFIIYMQALRFLTDHLKNDVYYRVEYPGHNLCRARNQFRLLQSYCAAEGFFQKIIAEHET